MTNDQARMTNKVRTMREENKTQTNRRSFLKSIGAAGFASFPSLTATQNHSAALKPPANGFRKLDPQGELRIGMIGIYGHTAIVLDAIPDIPGAQLVAYALQDGERLPAQNVRQRNDDAVSRGFEEIRTHRAFDSQTRVYKTYQEMLLKERLDAVGVCLPFSLNARASMAAAEKGIHIMSEKPLATELKELLRLEKVLQRTGAQVNAMLDMRLYPGIRTVRQAIRQGLIGEPILATAQKSYKWGKERPWFYDRRDTFGGTIPWIGIHAIDFILHTTGLSVSHAAALQSNKAHPDYPGTEDNAGILLKLSNGGTAVVTLDYLRPESAASHGDDRLRVIGSKGVVEMRGDMVELIAQDAAPRELPLLPRGSIFKDFVAYLRGQSAPAIQPAEAIAVTRICLLARQAADEQRIIAV
jgi:predicted dehydrogenase